MHPLELFLCLFGGGFGDLINKNCKGINYTFYCLGVRPAWLPTACLSVIQVDGLLDVVEWSGGGGGSRNVK
jgi:hypothetical protein